MCQSSPVTLVTLLVSLAWMTCAQKTAVSRPADTSCCEGSVATGSNNKEIDYLKSVVALLSQNILSMQEDNRALTDSMHTLHGEVQGLKDTIQSGACHDSQDGAMGTNYVRWGRTLCPETAQILYEGFAAKSHYSHTGGGANYICLDKNPSWPDVTTAGFQSSGHIYGVEYQRLTGLDSSLLEYNAPCAVCHVEGRGEHLMIPGNRTCPLYWTKEYEGLLVSQPHSHQKATYVCLDGDPEKIEGGSDNENGGLFYTVEAACGSLPCPPYGDGYEIACVVCTH